MSVQKGIALRQLTFTGEGKEVAQLTFGDGLSLLYGASNTGKSFAFKSLDFMLGASRSLPEITERKGYDTIWLFLSLPDSGDVTLVRPMVGGPIDLYQGHVLDRTQARATIRLSVKHNHKATDNLSQFLLEQIGLPSHVVAKNPTGAKRTLSFRDLARFCLVDETTIQSEKTPAETGERGATVVDRSVFKLLLTGEDDKAVVTGVAPSAFRANKTAKLEEIEEMLSGVVGQIEKEFPASEGLQDQAERLEASLQTVKTDAEVAREAVLIQLAQKTQLVTYLSGVRRRYAEVVINLARFKQLQDVYLSDVGRLEALEEASFLLLLGGNKPCPLCGAPPEAQLQSHSLTDIESVRSASVQEIATIRGQNAELARAIGQLTNEEQSLAKTIADSEREIQTTESELERLKPEANRVQQKIVETIGLRDELRRGLSLLDRRNALVSRRAELKAMKPTPKADRPKLGLTTTVSHEFAQTVSEVLGAWQFPGQRHVSFDDSTFDLRIDGKHRRDNGKGVRAITHAAFKVALIMFCHERKLPHPGFVILDTPLLTYRDPIRSRAGALTPDEAALKNTSLKEHFFAHLASLNEIGQFIVLENVDPPEGIESLAEVETFVGEDENDEVVAKTGDERMGLFPVVVAETT